jgi:hypothetical protein
LRTFGTTANVHDAGFAHPGLILWDEPPANGMPDADAAP